MIISTKAIVLSKLKYGDSDLIVRCYTESFGIKSYLLRGVLNAKKGKIKKAYIQPLSQLFINASHKENRSLQTIREIKPIINYATLYSNVLKSGVVMFLSEVLSQVLKEEEKNEPLYSFISNTLDWFDTHEQSANFHLLFLLDLTKYLGFYPDTQNISAQSFNLEEGKFDSNKQHRYSISNKNLAILKQLLGIKFDALNSVKLNSKQRLDFLNMILLYFELHLGDFKKPKSLQILNQIFN